MSTNKTTAWVDRDRVLNNLRNRLVDGSWLILAAGALVLIAACSGAN